MTPVFRDSLKGHPDSLARFDWLQANIAPITEPPAGTAHSFMSRLKQGDQVLGINGLTAISAGKEIMVIGAGKTAPEAIDSIFNQVVAYGKQNQLVRTSEAVNTGKQRDIIRVDENLKVSVTQLPPQPL